MTKLITILFLCLLSFSTKAQTTYHVASDGSGDFTTIAQVNAQTFSAGDQILFKRGDTFYGALIISNSGSSDNPITIGAYGTGSKPIITGLQTLSSWVDNGGGVYKASFSKSRLEVVSFNDNPQNMGRWPNTGSWRTYNASSSATITDASTLTGSWVGSEAVIRKTRWTLDRNPITGQSGNTLTFTPANSGNVPTNGCGYFIQNSLATLDTLGEWYNDGSNLYMYFGANSPSSYTVKVASIDNLLWLNHADYVTIKNIQFNGSDSCGVVTNVATNLTVDSCDFDLQGIAGVQLGWGSTNTTISNCTFNNSYTNAITFANNCAHAIVSNNSTQNTNIIYGSGSKASWDVLGDAIVINSDSATASNNTVTNAGHNGIRLSGLKILCENNNISNVGLTRYDVGAIYTWVSTHDMTGTIIRNNNIHDCMGTDIMWLDNPFVSVQGIYLDDTKGVSILSNTITNVDNRGINLNNYDNVEVHDNTVTDARGSSLALTPFSSATMAANITRNTFVTTHAPVAYYDLGITVQPTNYAFTTFSSSHHTTFPNVGIVDSNHFYRTSSSEVLFNTSLSGDVHWYGTNRTLSDWQTFTGLDAHSDMTVGTPTPPVAAPTLSLSGNQTIIADNTTVSATATWASGHTGTYLWTQTSGTTATITNPTSATTTITGLSGHNTFKCTVTQDDSQTANTSLNIYVDVATANAGSNQSITLPTSSATLSGSGTSSDGTVSSYAWTQTSGTTATITSASSASTTVTGMSTSGVRVFQLLVTDSYGATATSNVTITVNPATLPPTVTTSGDQTIATNSTTVFSTPVPASGETITGYLWTDVTGSGSATITSPTSQNTGITELSVGTHTFRITITQSDGQTAYAEVSVTLSAAPTANAGSNQTITLPTSQVTLSGSGTVASGQTASYLWTKVSGPGTQTITGNTTLTPTISVFTEGTYVYQLKVTQTDGQFATSTITITVNPAVTPQSIDVIILRTPHIFINSN